MALAQRVAVTKTDLPPCCVRMHPDDKSIIISGTYELNKLTGNRHGSIEILKLDLSEMIPISSYKTSGAILDLKFSPYDNTLLVSCHSTGNVMVWRCKIVSGSIELTLLHDQQIFSTDTLITSLNFSPGKPNLILLTLTTGESLLISIDNLKISDPLLFTTKHDLECWTGAFGSQGLLSNVVFTGGDDFLLIAHDIREPDFAPSIFKATKIHDAGVVSILPSTVTHNGVGDWNLQNPYLLWTGSYDDCLRSLDLRVMSPQELIPGIPPLTKTKLNLGGGVWRLIPSPKANDNRLLACCMYDGARIIDMSPDGEPEVVRYFKKDHESMCYGGDWSVDGDVVVTCSFYDKVVQAWSPDTTE